jgi:hypothetical protein
MPTLITSLADVFRYVKGDGPRLNPIPPILVFLRKSLLFRPLFMGSFLVVIILLVCDNININLQTEEKEVDSRI